MAKRKRKALPLIGAVGVLAATSASANAPAIEPEQSNSKTLILAEEEIFDVSLGTFYVFDKEREFGPGVRVAAGRCGGCGGCGGHGGGCGGGGCAGHGGGCAMHGGGCAVHGGGCMHGGGCRGCGGCGRGCAGFGLGFGLGILGGCGGCGSCYTWDPFLQQWVYSC